MEGTSRINLEILLWTSSTSLGFLFHLCLLLLCLFL